MIKRRMREGPVSFRKWNDAWANDSAVTIKVVTGANDAMDEASSRREQHRIAGFADNRREIEEGKSL